MEYWQWDSHGDKDSEYSIKVVVFWEQTREETAKHHPVDKENLQDFRYVNYSKAVAHLERTIRDFRAAGLDGTLMEKALDKLKKAKIRTTR